MKKLTALTSCLLALSFGAYAQYMPMKAGEVLTYESRTVEDNKIEKYTSTVIEMDNQSDLISVTLQDKYQSADNPFSNIEDPTFYAYTPSTGETVHTIMTAELYKSSIIASLREMIKQSGEYVSEQDFATLEKTIKPKGNIKVPIPAKVEEGETFPNSTIRCSIMGQSAGVKIVKGSYLGYEEIEVPAGKFNCVKLTYTLSFIGEGADQKITTWYAPEVGMVKNVVTDKKGKELSVDTLTAVSTTN